MNKLLIASLMMAAAINVQAKELVTSPGAGDERTEEYYTELEPSVLAVARTYKNDKLSIGKSMKVDSSKTKIVASVVDDENQYDLLYDIIEVQVVAKENSATTRRIYRIRVSAAGEILRISLHNTAGPVGP